ncbi:nose resistant to fluoxetine protein 6-like [Spodoptera litura]|uniref:Nose resistant to fluoxetine protein 6-like n=1 Tax=Spodoptera litura TaxID=69820 RepID=A0A9J7J609_SPOLT|nr:nose resistant to fluoxetine protein 6-like [Spodoptera litura]
MPWHVYPLATNKPQADTFLDSLAHKLKLEKWEKDEVPCLENILNIFENVKNHTLWATWILNANALPTGNLYGSYVHYASFDQCMKPPWLLTHPELKTKYCMTEVQLSDISNMKKLPNYDPFGPSKEFINSPTASGMPVNYILWGVCIPASCSSSAVSKLSRVVYEAATFSTIASDVTVKHCQEAGESLPYSTGFYIFIAMTLSLAAIAVASTYYRMHVSSEDQSSNSLITIITKSFCMYKNREDLIKDNKDEIRVMNGIKFLNAVTVISVHVLFYMALSGISNSRDYDLAIEGMGGLFLHIDIIVDTFFAISGLLHIKGLLGRRQNLLSVLLKRYIRLIGPFAVIIFYLISVSKHTGDGPGWYLGVEEETNVCEKTWPKSLLMINTDIKEICHAVTWYVPCDYQLAILGTVLFFFYQKNRRFGFGVYAAAAVFSIIIPGVLTYWFRLPAVHFMDIGKIIREIRDAWEVTYTYTSPFSRASAYLVGVAMGYFMAIYKPADYRKSVSMAWSIFGTALSLGAMLAMLSIGYITKYREYNPLEAAFLAGTNRIVWAAAICCIIGMCEYGTVPIVSHILGWSVFTPLSRLSYGIYMIHPIIVQRHKFAQRVPHKFDPYGVVLDTTSTLVISIVLSYAMWLFVEAPLINITNQLFFNKSKNPQPDKGRGENGIQHQNGVTKTKVS